MNKSLLLIILVAGLAACSQNSAKPDRTNTKAVLGEKLYSETNLSFNRTMSCATCHNPDKGFIADRLNADNKVSAVSLGNDGFSHGTRNAPTASYAMFSPVFHIGTRQRFNKQSSNKTYTGALGGQFVDGRVPDLKGQAAGPPLNPVEMGMADKAGVVARIQENYYYVESFKHLYGKTIFDDSDTAYAAMADSISEFEKTKKFAPFDSKYDRFLRGKYVTYCMTMTTRSTNSRKPLPVTNTTTSACHRTRTCMHNPS
jgi:cytochrome c peroxidase